MLEVKVFNDDSGKELHCSQVESYDSAMEIVTQYKDNLWDLSIYIVDLKTEIWAKIICA